jgi:hypothetical protein
MKQMKELDEGGAGQGQGESEGGTGEGGDGPRRKYEFWMTAVAEPGLVSSIKSEVLKDASKKAAFPGFRKGQVPPYAMPQIVLFSVQESLIKTVESALVAYGLEKLEGNEGQVTVHEDVDAIAKQYKAGSSIPFTATFAAAFAAGSAPDGASEAVKAVVDAGAEAEADRRSVAAE